MRYITIPQPLNVTVTVRNGEKLETKILPYGLSDLNAQEVWPHESWHQDLSSGESFVRIYSKFKGKKPGQVVALEDADYERYMPLATMRGVKVRPDLAYEMNILMMAVHAAASSPPEGYEKQLVQKLEPKTKRKLGRSMAASD